MKDLLVLGKGCVYPTDSPLNNNVLVCGSSGTGKTMSISEPLLLETYQRSLIVTMTKRRILHQYSPLLLGRGYQVYDLNLAHPDQSNIGYDPLMYISSFQDITFLAEAIVKADPRKEKSHADPYWDTTSVSLLSAEIAYVLMTQDDCTFSDVLKLHDRLKIEECGGGIETTLDREFECIGEADPSSFAYSCWKSFRMLPMRTAGCVYSSLNTTLDSIFTADVRQLMAMDKLIDLEKVGAEKSVLFVTTSPVNHALHCFVNIFYSQLFKQLFEFAERQQNGILPIPVHVLCDDFATGGQVLNFAEYISIFREKGLSVTLLIQSESQLESMYGHNNAVTIIDNCDQYVFLGGMNLQTAQNISLRFNKPLEDILYMSVGKEIVFRRGQKPILTERYNITDDSTYQQLVSAYSASVSKQTSRSWVRRHAR